LRVRWPDIVNAGLDDDSDPGDSDGGPAGQAPPLSSGPGRHDFWNPLWPLCPPPAQPDRRRRFLVLMMLAPDPHWPDLCARLGRPELAADPRFADTQGRQLNSRACVEALDTIFKERPLAHWRAALAGFAGEWAPVQTPAEAHADPQVVANGYIGRAELGNGACLPMVGPPAQFDEQPARPSRAPEVGEHTESVMLEMGLSWDEITALKDRGAIT